MEREAAKMQIITVAIQKGGTGKTTTAAAVVQAAAYRGRSVLAIDLDPQGNLSFTLAADTSKPGSYDLLGGAAAADLIQHKPGYDVIPASWNLSTITSGRGSARRLQKAIEPLKKEYDLIVIDTPPTAGELQYNALQAATGLGRNLIDEVRVPAVSQPGEAALIHNCADRASLEPRFFRSTEKAPCRAVDRRDPEIAVNRQNPVRDEIQDSVVCSVLLLQNTTPLFDIDQSVMLSACTKLPLRTELLSSVRLPQIPRSR